MTDLARFAARAARLRPDLADPHEAWGKCVEVSADLARRYKGTASFIQINGENYPGRVHWALIDWADDDTDPADFTVVDLTARQFDADAAFPWIGTLTDWYDDACEWLTDGITVAVYRHHPLSPLGIAEDPFWHDAYSREDVTPGPNVWPWQRSALDAGLLREDACT